MFGKLIFYKKYDVKIKDLSICDIDLNVGNTISGLNDGFQQKGPCDKNL